MNLGFKTAFQTWAWENGRKKTPSSTNTTVRMNDLSEIPLWMIKVSPDWSENVSNLHVSKNKKSSSVSIFQKLLGNFRRFPSPDSLNGKSPIRWDSYKCLWHPADLQSQRQLLTFFSWKPQCNKSASLSVLSSWKTYVKFFLRMICWERLWNI